MYIPTIGIASRSCHRTNYNLILWLVRQCFSLIKQLEAPFELNLKIVQNYSRTLRVLNPYLLVDGLGYGVLYWPEVWVMPVRGG